LDERESVTSETSRIEKTRNAHTVYGDYIGDRSQSISPPAGAKCSFCCGPSSAGPQFALTIVSSLRIPWEKIWWGRWESKRPTREIVEMEHGFLL
jgi:hypothetical protein